MKMFVAAGLVLVALGGYALGSMRDPTVVRLAPPVAAAPAVRTVTVPAPAAPIHAAEVEAAVRAAIRAELARAPEGEPAPEEPTPDEVAHRAASFEQARGIVDRAVGAGRWTRDDVIALRGVLPDLGPEEFDAVMSALIAPVNAGRVDIQTHGSLLDPS